MTRSVKGEEHLSLAMLPTRARHQQTHSGNISPHKYYLYWEGGAVGTPSPRVSRADIALAHPIEKHVCLLWQMPPLWTGQWERGDPQDTPTNTYRWRWIFYGARHSSCRRSPPLASSRARSGTSGRVSDCRGRHLSAGSARFVSPRQSSGEIDIFTARWGKSGPAIGGPRGEMRQKSYSMKYKERKIVPIIWDEKDKHSPQRESLAACSGAIMEAVLIMPCH